MEEPAGLDLLDVIAGRDHLILVDAVNTGSPPGTIVRLKDEQIPAVFRTKSSPHQLGLQDVLALLRLLDSAPAHVTVIGVQPASLELGLELTPLIAARLDAMVEMVADELTALGVPMTHVSSPQEQQRRDDPPLDRSARSRVQPTTTCASGPNSRRWRKDERTGVRRITARPAPTDASPEPAGGKPHG